MRGEVPVTQAPRGAGERNRGVLRRALVAAALASALTISAPGFGNPAGAQIEVQLPPDAFPIDVNVAGANGVGHSNTPGRACGATPEAGGDGAYWHYNYVAPLAGGTFGVDPSEVRFHLDLHSNVVTRPQPGLHGPIRGPNAFLLGEESHASLINKRGTIKVRLSSGTCADPTLLFDGTTVNGGGGWTIGATSGSYRGATAIGGGFTITDTDVVPGADNPFALKLNGFINILKPSLKVEVVGTYWGFMGVDYALRRVTVIYKITNTGPGDAFGVQLASATSPTNGAKALGPVPQKLGDLLNGESDTFRVQYSLSVVQAKIVAGTTIVGNATLEPCQVVILNCKFRSVLGVSMPDALDRATTYNATVDATAPVLPPPL